MRLAGMAFGAVIGLLLGIAWDVSPNTSLVEGTSNDLTFRGIVLCGVGGAVAGLLLGLFFAFATTDRGTIDVQDPRQRD